ncbi:transcriptional regulator [Kitasatospora sp. NPDC053057]|uniref:transcriptional regulator n=1 Tax=Kitasatospora sp. NPDC053057 TaxID=3364062 RepID=UPI0037C67920
MTAAPLMAEPAGRAEPTAPRTPGEAVALLAARRATGALHGPLGILHLVDGQVAAAESPRAPGLADLLTGCGRITPEDWAELLHHHGPQGRLAEVLVERQLLTRGELELGHLGTLFDAAYFVLADRSGGTWRFESGARHWLGTVALVDPARLGREVERRRRLLDGIWPWPQLDTAPVRPVERSRRPSHRPPGRRRGELLDHADGRRTPADLARLLGRSGFGVTADVRRLAAAGLLDAPRHAAPTTTPPAAEPGRPGGGLHRRVPGATLRSTPAVGPAATGLACPAAATGLASPAAATGLAATTAPTSSDRPPTTAAAHPLTVPDPDIALLTRVRDLLEVRL